MTIEDVIKKSILPLAFMVFWFWMTKTIMKVSGQTDWFWWVFIAGLPFGIHKMRLILIPRGMDTTATLVVYEACIDALAHMTLEEGKRDKYRLSLGGIAAPKENTQIQSERFKKLPDALEEFLKNHPEIKEIEICTDNDFAGRWAKEQMKKHYEGTYQIICNLPEKEGADYADLAKEKKQTNKCRDRPLERR